MLFNFSTKRTNSMYRHRNSLIGITLFILLFFASCGVPEIPVYIEGELIPVDQEHIGEKDQAVDSIIAIYRETLEEEMEVVLAHSAQRLERGTPEGLLNNFVADLIMKQGQDLYIPDDGRPIDFTLLNYGGLRAPLPEGPVTRANIFELMPFENEMLVLTLTPESTREAFEYLAQANVGMPVSGIELVVTDDQVDEVYIQGEPFDDSRNYKVLTSDYLAGGGDDMRFFLDAIEEEVLGKRIRDAIIAHVIALDERGEKINSELDGRIRMK